MSLRVFDANAVRRHAPMAAVIREVRQALIRSNAGEFEAPQRMAFGDGYGLVMPVYHPQTQSMVVKSLTLDKARNPLIKGTVCWLGAGDADPFMADAPTVTSLRTAAIVGVAADLLASPDADTAVIYGAGVQGIEQARALLEVRKLRRLTMVSRTLETARKAAAILTEELPNLCVDATTDPASILPEADIIGCATTSRVPLFEREKVKAGSFIAAIGSYTPVMHEIPQKLLAAAGHVYVDDVSACLEESGEIIDAIASDLLSVHDLIPLGQALQTRPTADTTVKIFKSVGFAPQDWAVMQVLAKANAA